MFIVCRVVRLVKAHVKQVQIGQLERKEVAYYGSISFAVDANASSTEEIYSCLMFNELLELFVIREFIIVSLLG